MGKKQDQMRTYNKLLRIFILIACLSFLFPSHSGFAQNEKRITLEDLGFTNDETFQGVLVNRTFGIELPKRWVIEDDGLLTIVFSHSEALHPSSSMTVDWNGERVGSSMLTRATANKAELVVNLSADQIIPGFNTLEIQFYMGITDDFCLEYDNPAVWAVVHNQTSIEIDPSLSPVTYELNLTPGYLIDSSVIEENEITILVPEVLGMNNLNALAVGSAKLGQMADWRNLSTNVISYTDAIRQRPAGNLILVGTIEELSDIKPSLIPDILSVNESEPPTEDLKLSLSESDGLIAVIPSPYDPNSIALVFSGLTGEGVEKSARAFTNDQFMNNVTGSYAIIKSLPDLEQRTPGRGKEISFEMLGFEDRTAFGTREQTILYNIPLTALWHNDTDAVFDIRLNHSVLVSEQRSTLSVLLNGVPVGSVALDESTAQDGLISMRIPLRFFEIGNNNLSIRSSLQIFDRALDWRDFCTDDTFTRAWLTIHSDSHIIFPDLPLKTENNIVHFPYGFLEIDSIKNFKFVMVPEVDYAIAEIMSLIAIDLGRFTLGDTGQLRVIEPVASIDQNANENLVFIGLTEPTLLAAVNKFLPMPYDEVSWQPLSIPLFVDYEPKKEGLGVIQSFILSDDRQNLIITSDDSQGLINAGKVITNPFLQANLDGQIALATSSEQVSVFRVEEQEIVLPIPEEVLPLPVEDSFVNQPAWVVNSSLFIIVVSMLILIVKLIQARKGE